MSKRKTTLVMALVVASVAVLGLAGFVFAKYVSPTFQSGSGSVAVAKWAFTSDNEGKGSVKCDLSTTYNPNTLVAERIAPGTTGTCEITISNENSEVGVNYTIAPSSTMGGPQNLVFKKDGSTFTTYSNTLAPGATEKVTIDWEWPYGTGDATEDGEDTADGEAANSSMTVVFDVSGYQVQPN